MMSRAVLVLAVVCLVLLTSGCTMPWTEEGTDHRQEMRGLVQSIAREARGSDPDFIVIPQNGLELLTRNGRPDGSPATGYLESIDGVAKEDLFYGYNGLDRPTPVPEIEFWSDLLNVSLAHDKPVLVTDYCSQRGYVWDSLERNTDLGFLSFAANTTELDAIPEYPAAPRGVNGYDVGSMASVENFLYLINPGAFLSREAYIDALADTNFDLLVIDAFYNGTPLTGDEVASLKVKANGGARLVVSYMSIGEAEDYRYYWNYAWSTDSPGWMGEENPAWEGNYPVEYWNPAWKQVIYKADDSYLRRVMEAGFDGVYLDGIDVYEQFE